MLRRSAGKGRLRIFLLIATFYAFLDFQVISGQTFESTSTEEKRPLFDELPSSTTIISTTIDNQQPRKDLNELPEMKKAKELKAENEKAEIEASRMHELALIEAELRQKETTEVIEFTTILPKHLINEDEKNLNVSQNKKVMTFEESKGMKQVEPSPHSGDAVDESVGFEINNFTTTILPQEGLNSEVSFPPLHTTLKASTPNSKLESGGDGESNADDPFQTSTSTFEDDAEHETIHETMHVQAPKPFEVISQNVSNANVEEVKENEDLSPTDSATQSTDNESKVKNNKEMTEPPFIEANPEDKSEIKEKVDDLKEAKIEEHPHSESAESKIEGAHPIAFMESSSTSHTELPLSTSQMTSTTTEEPAIMVGDKSVFEGGEDIGLPAPEKAQIHHMSNENGEMDKEEKKEETLEEEQTTKFPNFSPSINVGSTNNKNQEEINVGGFVLSKEEMEESKITTKKPEENDSSKMSTVPEKPFENEGKIVEDAEPEESVGGVVENHSTINIFDHSTTFVTPTDRISITQENMEKETNESLNINDSVKSTEILMTTTINNINEEETKHGEEEEEKGEVRSDDDGDSMLPKTSENIDTSTPKRGDLPNGEETTIIAIEHEVEATTEMVEKKAFIASNETSDDNDSNHVIGEVQTTELPIITTTLNPEQMEKAKQHAFHTSFSIRFPDIEWRSEFSDLSSGAAKKLIEQIMEDLKIVLSKALGPSNTLLDVNISNLRMGSVLVDGEILTTEEVTEPQTLSAALEQAILAKGGELGGNSVDTDKLQIGGHLPNAGISLNNNGISSLSDGQQKREEESNNATNTGLIIGGAVIVGVLIIVFAVFAIVVFGLNNRRGSQGSLKLSGRGGGGKKREEISMVENGNGAFGQRRFVSANDVVGGGVDSHNSRQGDGVSLTALRSTNGGTGPQFTSPTNGYGTNRH